MSQLTAAALASHQDLCNQQQTDIADSYAATVVRQEQIHQYFSQLGVLEGHNLAIGQSSAAGEPHNGRNADNGSNTDRLNLHDDDEQQQQHEHERQGEEGFTSPLDSLNLFMPQRHQPQNSYRSSTDTPLERFLTLDGCGDPSYISRSTLAQTGCYGRMESVETRKRQAQASAERVVEQQEKAKARKGSRPDSLKYM